MSFPRFQISTEHFDGAEEMNVLQYLRGIVPQGINALMFSFWFAAAEEFQILGTIEEGKAQGYQIGEKRRIGGSRVKTGRWYVALQKRVSLSPGELLKEVQCLKDIAEVYGSDFYEIESPEG